MGRVCLINSFYLINFYLFFCFIFTVVILRAGWFDSRWIISGNPVGKMIWNMHILEAMQLCFWTDLVCDVWPAHGLTRVVQHTHAVILTPHGHTRVRSSAGGHRGHAAGRVRCHRGSGVRWVGGCGRQGLWNYQMRDIYRNINRCTTEHQKTTAVRRYSTVEQREHSAKHLLLCRFIRMRLFSVIR